MLKIMINLHIMNSHSCLENNKIEKSIDNQMQYRFEDLTNYISTNYGFFFHSNIMKAGIEAVIESKEFFDSVSEAC